MALHVHHCKCAYNKGGLCYSKKANACHHENVARGFDYAEIIDDPARPGYKLHTPYTETDCPGYADLETEVDLSIKQGDYNIDPYN